MKTTVTDNDDENYEVGYGKPPKHTRFPKGKSGNPNGRPKKLKKLADVFAQSLAKEIEIKGKVITKLELIVEAVIQHAVKGKPAALNIVLEQLAAINADQPEEFVPEVADRIALGKWIKGLEKQQPNEDVA